MRMWEGWEGCMRHMSGGTATRLVQAELAAGGLEHHLLVGRARDQPVDHHFLRLPDPVAARLRLHVVLRVPVGVVNDHLAWAGGAGDEGGAGDKGGVGAPVSSRK